MTESNTIKEVDGLPPWPVFSTHSQEIVMSPLNRRLFLGAAAASAIVSPSIASVPDPIFAAIEAHRELDRSLTAVLTEAGRLEDTLPEGLRETSLNLYEDPIIVETDSPEWIRTEKAAMAAHIALHDAEVELAGVVPTTMAGVVAILRYAEEYVAPGNRWPMNGELLDDDGESRSWEILVMRNCANALAKLSAA
jgi:hypothetical protein